MIALSDWNMMSLPGNFERQSSGPAWQLSPARLADVSDLNQTSRFSLLLAQLFAARYGAFPALSHSVSG